MSFADAHVTNVDATGCAHDERRVLMAVLAHAATGDIERGLAAIGDEFRFTDLRQAETGLVMLRGRMGGDGAPFNIGEATITRAAVQLASGERGFAYVLGRDSKKALLAALCDALFQTSDYRPRVERHVLTPLRDLQERRRDNARAKTAATRVNFFTLVRGEDER